MRKSDILISPTYYDTYLNEADDLPLAVAFQKSLENIDKVDIATWKSIGLKTYAPNKWTIHDIVQHLTDWERIFACRSLLAVREVGNPFRSFDENLMVENAKASQKSLTDLLQDLRTARVATIALFNSFTPTDFTKILSIEGNEMSVLAMGFVIIGHQNHHLKVIKERYLSL